MKKIILITSLVQLLVASSSYAARNPIISDCPDISGDWTCKAYVNYEYQADPEYGSAGETYAQKKLEDGSTKYTLGVGEGLSKVVAKWYAVTQQSGVSTRCDESGLTIFYSGLHDATQVTINRTAPDRLEVKYYLVGIQEFPLHVHHEVCKPDHK